MANTKIPVELSSTPGIVDNSNATAITIDSSENVGIGTASPAIGGGRTYDVALTIDGGTSTGIEDTGALELGGSTNVNDRIVGSLAFFNGDNSNAGATTRKQVALIEARSVTSDSNAGDDSGGNLIFTTKPEAGALAERMRIDSSGNVGIGCTPDAWSGYSVLQIGTAGSLSASEDTTFVGANAYSSASGWKYVTTDEASLYQQQEAQHVWYTAASGSADAAISWSERMRIDTSGNLLVGKTSSSIDASGAIIKPSGDYYSTVASGINTYHVYDTTNNVYTFYVGSNGGISNFSANNVNLSDEREKKNVEALPSQWDCLKHWDLKQFHYNADDDALPKKYGVIAQEIEPHCPEVIDVFKVDEDTERMGVKEQQMMWMAIKALQEAQTRIESLEARIAALES